MRIIVTGASGFVGRAAVNRLLQAGHEVLAVTRREKSCPAPVRVVGNIGSRTNWNGVLDSADCVVHLAAKVHARHEHDVEAYREVNTRGTLRLAERAATAGVRRFVFLSTAKVLGESSGERPFDDATPPAPVDAYAISKYEAEAGLQALAARTGMEVCILRPPLVYGPGVQANFLRLVQWVDRGVPLPLAAVRNRRSLLALENLVDAIVRCLEHPRAAGQSFLVADNEALSTPDLIRRIAAAMNRPVRLFSVPPAWLRLAARLAGRSDEIARLLGNFHVEGRRIRTLIDWTPPRTADDALAQTVAWYRELTAGR